MQDLLENANAKLKLDKARCAIVQRGEKLCLRGTFPAKPSASRQDWHRQLIFLGVNATPVGIKYAESEARKISDALDRGDFDWSNYLKDQEQEKLTFDDWIQRFKDHKFAQGISLVTWRCDYDSVLKNLKSFDAKDVKKLIFSTKANSKHRKRQVVAFEAFFKFAGKDIDLSEYKGDYSATKVNPRDIPTDDRIVECFKLIPSEEWRWAYGILATYGIRPCELDKLEFDDMPVLICHTDESSGLKGVRGDRRIYPFLPEWVDLFDLQNPKLQPKKNVAYLMQTQFRRHKLPFPPYALRHAWAIRTMELGLAIELSSAQMGHSVKVHSTTYHRWISDRHHAKAFTEIMERRNILPPENKLL